MKLYRHPAYPGSWIGEDEHGALLRWPAAPGGWAKRTPHAGPKRELQPAEPAEARGTGWPGGGTGRKPRVGGEAANNKVSIRATDTELEEWTSAAGGRSLSDWAREQLTAAARRARR